MRLEIERNRQRAATRLATLPGTHPLSQHVAKAARETRRSKHFSPLHDLMRTFKLKPGKMEKRQAVRFEAEWDPDLIIQICEDKEEALGMLEADDADVQGFGDGSGYEGGVGAAGVLYREGEEIAVLRYRLGSENNHEVYEGEVVGMRLVVHLAIQQPHIGKLSIWIDNTAAITATDTVT